MIAGGDTSDERPPARRGCRLRDAAAPRHRPGPAGPDPVVPGSQGAGDRVGRHIRSYQFSADYAYPQADVDRLRAQLAAPGWSQLVQVRKRGDDHGQGRENVDIYVALEDKKVKGLVIIACGPREFTIVNIIGTIDLDQIASLRKTFVPPGKAIG